MPEPLSPNTSDISLAYLRILIILDFKSGLLRSTMRLWSLLRNLYCVTKMSCTLMILLTMVYSLKNLCENTATLLTQSKFISRADAAEMIVALEEGHLPGQIKLVTSAIKRAISRKTAGQRDRVLVLTHPRSQ